VMTLADLAQSSPFDLIFWTKVIVFIGVLSSERISRVEWALPTI
jgi:hypothetical protein